MPGLVFVTALAMVLVDAPATAGPAPSDPDNPFSPTIWVTNDEAAAGAHPGNLIVRLSKPFNVCSIITWRNGRRVCTDSQAYEEQDFKRLVLDMPGGLAPDINAAPPCNPILGAEPGDLLWDCPKESQIGRLTGALSNCFGYAPSPEDVFVCQPTSEELGSVAGDVYMGHTGPGEQARLILLIGLYDPLGIVSIEHATRVDVSVNVDPHGRITTTADLLPDVIYFPQEDGEYLGAPAQVHDLRLVLWGTRGIDIGHPLLTNATSCGPKKWSGDAEGYAYNAWRDAVTNPAFPGAREFHGFGDGKTVPVAAPYTVQGCDKVPYEPRLTMRLSATEPNAIPDVTTTVEQVDGEATTGSVEVTFPKGFGINFDNRGGQCTDQQFEARACPAESITGDAVARSRLLPVDVGALRGKVYLGPTDLSAGTVALFVDLWNDWLPGGIRIKGRSTLGTDGRLRATFDDLPELPIQGFEMTLMGGKEKGLLKTPRHCGSYTLDAKFTSHAGRIHEQALSLPIACSSAYFDVEPSTRRAGAHPTLALRVGGPERIRSVGFTFPRELRQQKLSRLAYGRSYGSLTLDSRDATEEGKVTLVRGNRRRSKLFAPTRDGSAIAALGLSQPTRVLKRRVSRGKRKIFKATGKPTLWFRDLGDPATVGLELDGSRDGLLRFPRSCRYGRGKRKGKPVVLPFGATLVDGDGTTHRLTDSVTLSCPKRRPA